MEALQRDQMDRGQKFISLKKSVEKGFVEPANSTYLKMDILRGLNLRQTSGNLLEDIKAIVQELQETGDESIGCSKYNKPHVLLITADFNRAEDMYKGLLKAFKKFSGKTVP